MPGPRPPAAGRPPRGRRASARARGQGPLGPLEPVAAGLGTVQPRAEPGERPGGDGLLGPRGPQLVQHPGQPDFLGGRVGVGWGRTGRPRVRPRRGRVPDRGRRGPGRPQPPTGRGQRRGRRRPGAGHCSCDRGSSPHTPRPHWCAHRERARRRGRSRPARRGWSRRSRDHRNLAAWARLGRTTGPSSEKSARLPDLLVALEHVAVPVLRSSLARCG